MFVQWSTVMVCLLASTVLCAEVRPLPREVVFPGHGRIGADFNVNQQPEGAWRIQRVLANEFDHCYRRGEEISLEIDVANVGPTARYAARWSWFWIGDREADDRGGVAYVSRGLESEQVATLELAADGITSVRLQRKAPQEPGLLALFLTTQEDGREIHRWVTNIAVFWPVSSEVLPDSPFFGETRGVRTWQKQREFPTLAKLGVKWVRIGAAWHELEPQPGEYQWETLDAQLDAVRKHRMLAMFLPFNAPQWARSYGRLSWPRGGDHKQDLTPSPDHYGDWARLFEQVTRRHSDVVRAVNVWNEPWEAGGITDWGGTGAHYRQLHRMAHMGVSRADPTVLVGGNDSDANIVDNLMCDPHWRDYVNLLTVHSHGGFAGLMIHQRKPADMPLWNTEMWYTAQSNRTVQWQVMEMARGCSKVNLAMLGNFFTAGYKAGGYYDPKDPNELPDLVPQPNAVAYNTMVHMLEGHRMVEELSPQHRPYLVLFERVQPSTAEAEHGACVVMFGQSVERDDQAWPRADPGDEGLVSLPSLPGVAAFDRFGRRFEQGADGRLQLPMSRDVVYLTAPAAEVLRHAIADMHVRRFAQPLHLAIEDVQGPADDGARFRVLVTNAAPSPVDAKIELDLGAEWQLRQSVFDVDDLAPGNTRALDVLITKAGTLAGGSVMLTATTTTPWGSGRWREPLTFRHVPRFTPVLGEGAAQWEAAGITPVVLTSGADANALAAAMPWEVALNQASDKLFGRWALAYDQINLYLLAQMRVERRSLPWDQTREDWFALHPGGYAYKQAPEWPFTGENVQLAIDCRDNPDDYLYPLDDARSRRYPSMRVDYLLGFYETRQGGPQAWLYRRPSSPMRHRYPFSPIHALDQNVPTGVGVHVTYDQASRVTTVEAAVPWSILPEIQVQPGTLIRGIEVKLTTSRWSGLYSASGRGLASRDNWTFQPYWMNGFGFVGAWRLGD